MDILTILHKLKVDEYKIQQIQDLINNHFNTNERRYDDGTKKEYHVCSYCLGHIRYSKITKNIICERKNCVYKKKRLKELNNKILIFNDILFSLEKGEEKTIEIIIPILENELNEIKKIFKELSIRYIG